MGETKLFTANNAIKGKWMDGLNTSVSKTGPNGIPYVVRKRYPMSEE